MLFIQKSHIDHRGRHFLVLVAVHQTAVVVYRLELSQFGIVSLRLEEKNGKVSRQNADRIRANQTKLLDSTCAWQLLEALGDGDYTVRFRFALWRQMIALSGLAESPNPIVYLTRWTSWIWDPLARKECQNIICSKLWEQYLGILKEMANQQEVSSNEEAYIQAIQILTSTEASLLLWFCKFLPKPIRVRLVAGLWRYFLQRAGAYVVAGVAKHRSGLGIWELKQIHRLFSNLGRTKDLSSEFAVAMVARIMHGMASTSAQESYHLDRAPSKPIWNSKLLPQS